MCVICFHKEGMSAMSLPPSEKGASVRECQQSCRRSGWSVCLPPSPTLCPPLPPARGSISLSSFSNRVELRPARERGRRRKEGRKEGSSGVEGRATCKTVHVSTVCFFPFSFLFVSFPPSPLLSSLSPSFFLPKSVVAAVCRRP